MALVLLVEDERELARLIRRELEAAGHRVLAAEDGEEALRLHAEERPDALVLDWMLPKLDGLEVLRRVRESASTPVLMLTARGEEVDLVMGLEVGADDYLTKPFSTRELLARVRALLRRKELLEKTLQADRGRSGKEGRLGHGPLVLDPVDHVATVEGGEIPLSPTEFDLLHLLMRNPGRTFSRAYLLQTVWEVGYVGGDRSVDNVVMRLRKKLGDIGGDLETVWGIGYRLRKT